MVTAIVQGGDAGASDWAAARTVGSAYVRDACVRSKQDLL